MKLTLDPGAAALLDALHAAGYAAYAVGGCVRDSLLGRTAHDWDLCTSALPQQVMELFGTEQCIPTGLQHGTVTIKYGGQLYETTTFRTEGSYTDGRHPDAVQFVPDVREDLARRDFTINAMAYNETEGLVDPFGGQKDLQNGLLRAVGEPQQRFTEDALRILRLYRFAARFGFAIDPPTAQAAQELCAHLDCVSVERIEEELAKLLSAPAPAAYLDKKILLVILPELSSEALAAAKPVVDACPAGAENLPIRLAALLLSLGEDGIRRTLKRLRCSNALIEEAAVLVREARRRDGSFLFGHEYGLRHPADASCFEQHSHPAGRCSNSNSLFPPQAAVVTVAGHSIARPIACGNRVPPQRTVLRETPRTDMHSGMQFCPYSFYHKKRGFTNGREDVLFPVRAGGQWLCLRGQCGCVRQIGGDGGRAGCTHRGAHRVCRAAGGAGPAHPAAAGTAVIGGIIHHHHECEL